MRSAELIAVGTELLRPGRCDTHSSWLAQRLHDVGIEVLAQSVIADDTELIAGWVRAACARAELVLVTGGLGPTRDDRTREGLAQAWGVALESDPRQLERLRRHFASRGWPFTAAQARQAQRPHGAEWVDNPIGSAPGLWLERGALRLVGLPGVPAELRAMYDATIAPRLAAAAGRLALRIFRIAGLTESALDERIHDLYDVPDLDVTVLGCAAGLELQLLARGSDAAQAARRLDKLESQLRQRLGGDLYAVGAVSLPAVVAQLLRESGATLATAESCSGGLLASALTETPGASAYFRGGLVAYTDELKVTLAGVDPASLAREGAVSEGVARELAQGARAQGQAQLGLAITGIAGPDGGTAQKPVGQVHLALADGAATFHWKLQLSGDREAVRAKAVAQALDRLRRYLLARRQSGSKPA